MFDFLEDIGQSVSNTVHDAEASVGNWLGHGADASAPVTAEGAHQHAAAAQPDSWWGRLGQGIGDLGRGVEQEGLGGILDPAGMLDRQQAQRDLASRFQVVPDDFVGPRNHNQVSQEEFQQIAHTFSDVRTGRGDLTINSSGFDGPNADQEAADYRQGSMDMIANMMMTTSGRRQIENLHDNVQRDDAGDAQRSWWGLGPEIHRQTTVQPLWGVDNGTRDAKGNIVWQEPGAGNHTAANLRQDNGFAAPVGAGSDRAADGSRGTGTDVNILWNPGANNIGGQGARSDIILAHEMQHAVNQSQGTQAFGTFGGVNPDGTPRVDASFRNAERQAVGLTRSDSPTGGHYPGDPDGCTENTYRAERNQLGIGEQWLPREAYSNLPGQAANQGDFDTAWNRHNSSGNARP